MTTMNTEAAPLDNTRLNDNLECPPEEKARRLKNCQSCKNFVVAEQTVCSATGCNISLMTTFKFKTCPIRRW